MKRVLPIAVVAALALATAGGAQAHRHHRRSAPCRPPHSRTVLGTRHARIYGIRRKAPDGSGTYRALYGCLYSVDLRLRLDHSDFPDEDGYGPFALRGRFAAYGFAGSCGGCDFVQPLIEVPNLATGDIYRQVDVGSENQTEVVTSLVLKADDSIAWIVHLVGPAGAPPRYEVHKSDGDQGASNEPAADDTTLDSGSGIDPKSLRLSGPNVVWTKDGVRQSAPLR